MNTTDITTANLDALKGEALRAEWARVFGKPTASKDSARLREQLREHLEAAEAHHGSPAAEAPAAEAPAAEAPAAAAEAPAAAAEAPAAAAEAPAAEAPAAEAHHGSPAAEAPAAEAPAAEGGDVVALIKAGVLVSLRSSVTGGVSYERKELEAHADGDRQTKRWETERTVEDRAEWERAKKCRADAVGAIWYTCVSTEFGLVCPAERAAELAAKVALAKRLVAEHNASSKRCVVRLSVFKAPFAATDADNAEAVVAEVDERVAEMTAAAEAEDVETTRKVALKAQSLAELLADSAAAHVLEAVRAARAKANETAKARRDAAKAAEKPAATTE